MMKRGSMRAGLVAAGLLATMTLPGVGCAGDEANPESQAVPPDATTAREAQAASAYEDEIAEWQDSRRSRIHSGDGWLSLVGLHWLIPGDNRIGSATTNEIVLPARVAPLLGIVHLEAPRTDSAPRIRFIPEQDSPVTLSGKVVREPVTMFPDTDERPTMLEVGTITFQAIIRAGRIGIRVKDKEAPALREFKGLDYFAIDPDWRIEATFEPYDPPKAIPIANIIGSESEEPSPGAIEFKVRGRTYRLDVLDGGEDEVFVIFSDRTAGRETYGAGRYLYARKAGADRRMIIDFNRSYNPPCAFTEFATCPLPPRQNRLPFRVEAGELKYADDEH